MTDTHRHPNWLDHKIPVGISACLVGDPVRFNGGHSRSSYCLGPIADYFDYQTFCPEMAAGFGTPRASMHLAGDPEQPQLIFSKQSGNDLSAQLISASQRYLDRMPTVDGYILMKNSPSCGLERIKVYQANGHPHRQRRAGLFTQALQQRFPLLPIEEEGRLTDPRLRENFLLRVFAHHEFRHSVLSKPSIKALISFHSHYKYLVMAHSQVAYQYLGRLLSGPSQSPVAELCEHYFNQFMTALSHPAQRQHHCNVLMHLVGYLKQKVNSQIRQDILAVIEQYRRKEVNLTTPITLLSHYLRLHGSEYIKQQRYLAPYPQALGIRNTV